jgi:hypothetical protein
MACSGTALDLTVKLQRQLCVTVYRETSLLYALSAAALTHVVARACVDGSIRSCPCTREPKHEDRRRIRLWGHCGENFIYARRFTRSFLQLRQSRADSFYGSLVRHNVKVGIQVRMKLRAPPILTYFYEDGVGLVPKRGCLLTLAYYAFPRWYEFGERRWNDIDRGKLKKSEENLSQCHFVHYKSHMDWPGLVPGPPRLEAGY